MEFNGSVVMITGAGRGIGKAIADRFYDEGASLSLGVRRAEGFSHRYDPQRCLVANVDVRDERQLDRFVESTTERFGVIDVLVNNAGVDEPRPLAQITAAHLHDVMAVNFYSAVLLTRLVAEVMKPRRKGRVINISSIAGKEGTPHHTAYVASKHALLGFTKCAARELISYDVVVNAVCPGLIETSMLRNFFESYAAQIERDPEEAISELVHRIPRRKIGSPADVASLVLFLASNQMLNIVGQAINTDGGLLQW